MIDNDPTQCKWYDGAYCRKCQEWAGSDMWINPCLLSGDSFTHCPDFDSTTIPE